MWTIPQLRAEPYSYDVPTPSGISGTLASVYWKPEIEWVIQRIEVLSPIHRMTVRHNEVSAPSPKGKPIDVRKMRTQRRYTYLRDVDYLVHADLRVLRNDRGEPDPYGKHISIAERRLRNGQFYRQPYLGTAQCPVARIELLDDRGQAPSAIGETRSLGLMLWGQDWSDPHKPVALYYNAILVQGVVRVPSQSETVCIAGDGHAAA
jgi:CRISPR-associated protein Cas5d